MNEWNTRILNLFSSCFPTIIKSLSKYKGEKASWPITAGGFCLSQPQGGWLNFEGNACRRTAWCLCNTPRNINFAQVQTVSGINRLNLKERRQRRGAEKKDRKRKPPPLFLLGALLESPTCGPLCHPRIYTCVCTQACACVCRFWLPLCPGQIDKKSFLRIAC